jgi:NADPH2:quinone reductase
MKAIFLTRFGKAGEAFELRETELPKPTASQVLIKVEAFGLNFADVLARKGLYPEVPERPCILGYEVVGTITGMGEEVPKAFSGKRVIALTRFGGYSEYVATDYRALAVLPNNYPAEQAVALGTQFTTAHICFYDAVRVYKGDNVLIHAGAGGVGLALCQMALAEGCEVFATVGSASKVDFLKRLGVQHVINYSEEDYADSIRKVLINGRIDVSFNSIAGKSVPADLKLLGSGGRLVIYGAASRVGKRGGIFSSLGLLFQTGFVSPLSLIMRSKSVIGINLLKLGDYKPQIVAASLNDVVQMALPTSAFPKGKIRPVVGGRYSVSELAQAHEALENRGTIGKLSVFW